jgi:hypothetical protein
MIPQELVNRVRHGLAVPFIGSGLSIASGIASWNQLIGRLRASIEGWLGREVRPEELDLLEAPRLFSDLNESRQPLYDILDEAVGSGFVPNEMHHLLGQMPIKTYLTTNWDNLVERALQEYRPVNVVHDNRSVTTWREGRAAQVVKLHGSAHDHDSVVFGEEDYQRLYGSPSPLLNLTQTLFATRSVFAVGFGMRDSYVKLLFSNVARMLEGTQPPHYVVVPETEGSELHAMYLRSAGFVVVPTPVTARDPFGLVAFLTGLHRQTSTVAESRIDRTSLLIRETSSLYSYLGYEPVVRIRATMGPLAAPPPAAAHDDAIFGDAELHQSEWELRRLICDLLARGTVRVKLLVTPLAADFIMSKGYSKPAYKARLKSMVEAVRKHGDSIQLASPSRPSDSNTWIVSTYSLIESRKVDRDEQRLYSAAYLETDGDEVSRATRWFDEEFDTAVDAAGGLESSRQSFLNGAEELLL